MKKLERLKRPKTHLEKYQDDPHEKNQLFNFNLNSVRKRQQCTLMQKLALEVFYFIKASYYFIYIAVFSAKISRMSKIAFTRHK